MTNRFLVRFLCLSLVAFASTSALATGLFEVYQQALKKDPTFQQALAQRMVAEEAVPQARAVLFPQLGLSTNGGLAKTQTKALGNFIDPDLPSSFTSRQRFLGAQINLQQSLFNIAYWQQFKSAKQSVKAAVATYNAAAQNLIQRVINAYFAVLEQRDILRFTDAERLALYNEYLRAQQSYQVGLKSITDVYNAKAAYANVAARYIEVKNELEVKKEALRVITGVYYNDLNWLKQNIPLVIPKPDSIDKWVDTAINQNWSLQAARYSTNAFQEQIAIAKAGHLPTLDLAAQYSNNYTRFFDPSGTQRVKGPSAQLELNIPFYSGGLVNSKVREAIAQYEQAQAQQEQTHRDVINGTRTAYLGIGSSIKQIVADQQNIIANQNSLQSTREGYKVGTRTIIDVLNAEQALYQAQESYATDRYNYIQYRIALKLVAGVLDETDVLVIDQWLGRTKAVAPKIKQ